MNFPDLPISKLLPDIVETLQDRHDLVIEAAPGAGKTTLVPLALMNAPWRKQGKIIVLEPRRVAARAAAERMAKLLGEEVGQRVGYRIRLEKRVSKHTVIEVVTEGILTRWLQENPDLEVVDAVVFDEYHERNIHSDLGLALCLKAREFFRDESHPLKLVVMSATLDGVAVSTLLNDAPVIRSEGRSYEVGIRYGKTMKWGERIVEPLVQTVHSALQQQQGDVLVFVPGMAEIQRSLTLLKQKVDSHIELLPLHGSLGMTEQQKALRPLADKNKRKVILATDIAETSLTIDGVTTVVDSGLARKAAFDLRTGVTRLATQRISRASSVQRAGRAGRQGPGVCYRLWSEAQQTQLVRYATPEILASDLAPLVLQLLHWGIHDPDELQWLDAPPPAAVRQAKQLLRQLGALAPETQCLSEHGQRMAALPLHPRFAHMLLRSIELNALELASYIAAVLTEKIPPQTAGADFMPVLDAARGLRAVDNKDIGWQKRVQKQVKNFQAQILKFSDVKNTSNQQGELDEQQLAALLLAWAWPDRVARQRDNNRERYQLSNGRAANLSADDPLAQQQWLVVCDIGGVKDSRNHSSDKIYQALALDEKLFEAELADLIEEDIVVEWQDDRLLAEQRRCIGEIVLDKRPAKNISRAQKNQAIVQWLRNSGLHNLPWTQELQQWRSRIALLREHFPMREPAWPDLSDDTLTDSLEDWLLPFLDPINKRSDINKLDLPAILAGLLAWPLPKKLDDLAPQKIQVPSGSRYAIDYSESPPILKVKLQEMFGAKATPAIANGKIKLLVHLLSPAGRSLQITQDLEGFWNGAYSEVKKDMKGRYPKHPWPDNPWEMLATRLTNRRLRDKGN